MTKVLIVDDNADHAVALGKLLEALGHRVITAANGRGALLHVLNQPPDVVLLDLFMPEMDGPSFLEVIRSYLRIHNLPVVILSAIEDGPMVERAKALAVNCILAKGKATIDDIQRAINEALQSRHG